MPREASRNPSCKMLLKENMVALKASSENLFDFCFLKARVERLL